jgi:hypothetical protein
MDANRHECTLTAGRAQGITAAPDIRTTWADASLADGHGR